MKRTRRMKRPRQAFGDGPLAVIGERLAGREVPGGDGVALSGDQRGAALDEDAALEPRQQAEQGPGRDLALGDETTRHQGAPSASP